MKEYFLCSKAVVEHFKPVEVSKPFKSGYDFEKDNEFFVAVLDFEEVEKYYNDVIKPFNERSRVDDIDFWLRECMPGTMDVSKISLWSAKNNGLFVEIEDRLNLTNEKNRAMIICNLSQKNDCTPVELINRITK